MEIVFIGILGGSFDPIHVGHLAIARAALSAVDRVAFVVAADPPHKSGCVADFGDRVAMARLAADDEPRFEVWDIEGRREGPSYTFYTVTELSRERPQDRFALLIGADMLADLPTWHRAKELLKHVDVITFERPGFDAKHAHGAYREAFGPPEPDRIEVAPMPISSTEIRRRRAAGEPLEGWVTPATEGYIRERKLYLSG